MPSTAIPRPVRQVPLARNVLIVDGRYRGNFRRYGQGQKALKDPVTGLRPANNADANRIYHVKCEELEGERDAGRARVDLRPTPYVLRYIEESYLRDDVRRKSVDQLANSLELLFERTPLRNVTSITAIDRDLVTRTITALKQLTVDGRGRPDQNGRRLKPRTVRRHMMALSGMLSAAIHDGHLGRNAVNPCHRHRLMPKTGTRGRATVLEVAEAGRLLEWLRTHPVHPGRLAHAYEQAALQLYAGLRPDEAAGLPPDAVDFEYDVILVNVNEDERGDVVRGLKTPSSARVIPLQPKLKAILMAYFARVQPEGRLLFPSRSRDGARVQKPHTYRKTFLKAVAGANITKKIDRYTLRHTYATTRLQMVERVGKRKVPVAKHKVMMEMGHTSEKLLNEVYGHVQRTRTGMTELDYTPGLPAAYDPAPYVYPQRGQKKKRRTATV